MPKYEGTITPKNNRRIEPIRGNTQVMLDQLNDTRPGEHNIMVYPDLQTLNEVMANHYKTAIENRNELALFVTYYQPIQQVRQVLSQEGLDVAKYEKKGSLVIYDSLKGYQSSESVYPIMALINMLVDRVKKLNKSGMFGMLIWVPSFCMNELKDSFPTNFRCLLFGIK